MGTESRTLMAKFDGDTAGLTRAVDRAERKLKTYDSAADGAGKKSGGLSRAMNKVGLSGGSVSSALGKVAGAAKFGALGIGILGAGLLAAAPRVFEAAANLELLGRKAATVFGPQLATVQKWATANAAAMGLTTREAVALTAGFADLLIPMGFTRAQAAAMSTDVVGLSGALSEWSGGQHTASEVAAILSSAMLGERDALKSLGISITEADVDQRLMKNGTDKLKGAQLEQAKATATQQLIFEKSKDAQRAYASNTDTISRKMTSLKATVKNATQEILVKLTPALTKAADAIQKKVVPQVNKLVDWLSSPAGQAAIDRWGQKISDAAGDLGKLASAASNAIGWLDKVNSKVGGVKNAFTSAGVRTGEFFGTRAGGGDVAARGQYLVGEEGPEILTMGARSGHITPNDQLGSVGAGSVTGGDIIVENHIEIGGEVVRVVDQRIKAKDTRTRRALSSGAGRLAPV